MTRFIGSPVIISGGVPVETPVIPPAGREKTLAYSIMRAHDTGTGGTMRIKFDALISHDITYVGIIQTARASGMDRFPMPYAMTNCHNSLCAVGGTINEDDHVFGLSAAKKYGGIYVPANLAVLHQYAREKMAESGSMILGSDSHTRYGCFGAMGVGEGGGELVKQLLGNTWDIEPPEVVLVWLSGSPRKGVGPHDVALSLVRETFPEGRVKNKILEFAGPGLANLSMDFRSGIDVMTTETGCLSSIWETDNTVDNYYNTIGRPTNASELRIKDGARYDAIIHIDLDSVDSMIALPFHPSRAVSIHELQENPHSALLAIEKEAGVIFGDGVESKLTSAIRDGKIFADQGVIVGCAGGSYENIAETLAILRGGNIGNGYFSLSVYPASAPISLAITRDGTAAGLMDAGALIKPAFCGPCFGAGDTPSNNGFSMRHATRNFPNREGSKPGCGQLAFVALMDARSIAASARNGGELTAATDIEYDPPDFNYRHDNTPYEKRVYNGFGNPDPESVLRFGPNIADWPYFPPLGDNLLIRLCAVIEDEVTTTDELIPSGETSSYRSNPAALSEFTLSRRCPEYVGLSKSIRDMENERRGGKIPEDAAEVLEALGGSLEDTSIGSCIFAKAPGDGSAREQAASCQKVLGGFANICHHYATKRYRSNCINWGIIPFTMERSDPYSPKLGDWIYFPEVREYILSGNEKIDALVLSENIITRVSFKCDELSAQEREILTDGCLMNYYARNRK